MTSLLKHAITAHRCRSTHHFIAIGALDRFKGPQAKAWHDLILLHHEELLRGAKAPDAEFKDFKNHVLHVGEGEWGGARDAATEWYANAVLALRDGKWARAAYALGVMSHYYADPLQPFHTGQTEEEGAHQAGYGGHRPRCGPCRHPREDPRQDPRQHRTGPDEVSCVI